MSTHVYLYIYLYIYMYIYITYVHLYICKYMNIYLHIAIYIYICTHTYILRQNTGGTWSPQISTRSHELCARTSDCFKSAHCASSQCTPSWCIFAGVFLLRLSWNERGRRYLSEWMSECRSYRVAAISKFLKTIDLFCRILVFLLGLFCKRDL